MSSPEPSAYAKTGKPDGTGALAARMAPVGGLHPRAARHGHRHVGSLHAPDAEMAIKNARDVYTRRNEGVSIWVVPSSQIIAAARPTRKAALRALRTSKVYRHPTFFDIPDEVGAM